MTEPWIESLTPVECVELLRAQDVGRVAFVVDDFPVVLPVNYRLIERAELPLVAIRTRPGNVIDRAPMHVAFQVDEIDRSRRQGWSIVIRGVLRHLAAAMGEQHDPHPWLLEDRDSWILIDPATMSGRRLHSAGVEWAFHAQAYL